MIDTGGVDDVGKMGASLADSEFIHVVRIAGMYNSALCSSHREPDGMTEEVVW
jgi:hypothetical protein